MRQTLSLFGISIILIVSLISSVAQSKVPLFFPADKNKIKILPQTFEYTLVDSDRIRIGDILIDANLLRFEIVRPPGETKVQLLFSWPAGLLQDGGLYLVNNNGRAIWDSPIVKKNITIAKVENKESPELRTDLAQLTSELIDPELFENMKYFPFMKFCVSQSQGETRIELCSKELYLSMVGEQLTIKGRASNRQGATVTVNGKTVGDQGYISLSDLSQIVSFRAEAVSGAILNIETRRKDVEFKDVTIGKDSKTLVFEAQGAEPATEANVTRLRNGNWRTVLPIERPVIYLQGEGGIPLRQEFFVQGAPPKAEARAFLNPGTPSKTYDSEVVALGTTPPGTQIKNLPKDPPSLSLLSQNKFRWRLGPMTAGEVNHHFAQVTAGEGSWIGGYDIYRGHSIELALLGSVLSPWNLVLYRFESQYWFERFLGISSSFFRERWGIGFSQDSSLSNKASSPSLTLTQVELTTRFSAGLNYKDPSWGMKLKSSALKLASSQVSTLGVGLFYRGPSGLWGTGRDGWATISLDYLLPSKTTDLDFKGVIQGRALFERRVWSKYFFNFGLLAENWGALDVARTDSTERSKVDSLQLGLITGLRVLF